MTTVFAKKNVKYQKMLNNDKILTFSPSFYEKKIENVRIVEKITSQKR